MSEIPYNPNDPAFLASRSLDETLPSDARQRLDEALAESEEIKNEAAGLAAVDALVREWGADEPKVDSDPFVAMVTAAAGAVDETSDLHRVDEWVRRWSEVEPEADADEFTAGIMRRLAGTRRRPVYSRIFRIGAPLAAAAAVTFAVMTGFRSDSARLPSGADEATVVVEIGPGRLEIAAAEPMHRTPSTVVAFAREAPSGGGIVDAAPRVAFMSFGAGPHDVETEAMPPL